MSTKYRMNCCQRLNWWFRIFVLAIVFITSIIIWAKFRFGSLTTARAYYRGQVVEVTFPTLKADNLGSNSLPTGDTVISFTNNAPETITIIGAIADCRCIDVKDLPLSLAPLSNNNVARIAIAKMEKYSNKRILFITNSRLVPHIVADLPNTKSIRNDAQNHNN